MHSLSGSALLQEALLLTTLCSSSSSSSSSNSSNSSSSSELLSRIAPSLLRARVTFHLTVLALFAVASHIGRAPQRCAATVQRQLLQHGLTALLTNAVSEPAVAAATAHSNSSNSCYDSTNSVHYGDRLSAQYSSAAAVAPGLRVTVCEATVLSAVLESTARIYGTTSTTSTATAAATAAGDSHSDGADTDGVPDCVMAAAGQQAVLCAPVNCASGYAAVQLLNNSNDADATTDSGTLTLPLRALYVTPPELLLHASELSIGSSVRIAQRDWLQHVLQSIQITTGSTSTSNSNNSVLLSIAGEAAAVVALGNSDWVGVQTAAGTEAAVPLAALRLATSASTTAVAAAARSSSRRGSSASTAVSRKSKLAAVTRHRRGSATSERTRNGDSPVQLTSPLQHSSRQGAYSSIDVYAKRKHSSSSNGSSSARHSATQREQLPAYNVQSSAAVEASISSSADSGVRLLPAYADRAAVSIDDNSEAVAIAAEEPFSLVRVRGPPPPRRPANTGTASATPTANTQRALYREPEPTQGRVLGHATDSYDDSYHTDAAAAHLWGTDGRVLRRSSAPAAVAVVYNSPSPPQKPRSARVRSASLSAATATATAAAVSTEAALLHTEHIDHLQQQQQQSQQRRRRPSTASANSQYSSGSVPLHSATLYFEQQPPPQFSERRASSSSSSSGAVCTGPACRTGIAAANSSAGSSDGAKQQQQTSAAKPWRPPAGSSAALKQQDIATVRKLNAKVAARLARTVRTERARDEAVYDRLLASRVRRAQVVAADSAAAVAAATATAATAAAVPETASDDASADASAAALAAELDELSSTGVDERLQDVLARLQRRRRSSSASISSGSGAVVRDSASWKAELRRKLGLPPAAVAADATARSSRSAKGSWGYSKRSSYSSPQKNGAQRPKTAPGRQGSAEQEHSDNDSYTDNSNAAAETLLI
jgi:trimeric autotransporter adhesin